MVYLGVFLCQKGNHHAPCLLVEKLVLLIDLIKGTLNIVWAALVLHSALRAAMVLLLNYILHCTFSTVAVLSRTTSTEQGSTVFGLLTKHMQQSIFS